MYRVFISRRFWHTYLALCGVFFVAAITVSSTLDLAGKDFMEIANQDGYLLVMALLTPIVFLPGFFLIGLIQRLKR